MKAGLFILSLISIGLVAESQAASTINAANKYAYGANVGWLDFRGDTNNGVVIGEYVCSGNIYAANVGWINLGGGVPVNNIQYQNNAANDYGVNHDGAGNLRGYAYGANIGWINFETTGAPRVDLKTGKLSGSVYSANVGWISLSNAVAYVQTDTIAPGLMDTNGLPFAWEYQNFGGPGVNPNADPDGDGMSNLQEYLADTNPNLTGDNLKITAFSASFLGLNDNDTLTWTSKPTRQYKVQYRSSIDATPSWLTLGFTFTPDPGPTTTGAIGFGSPSSQRYFRVQAVRPLAP
jgi:hypothetical protein